MKAPPKRAIFIALVALVATLLVTRSYWQPPVAGLLGAETLRRHHGIIDFGTRTLYLR